MAGPKEFIEALRPKARSFIFTASPMAPCLTAAAAKAVDLVMENTALVDKLWENRNYFADRLSKPFDFVRVDLYLTPRGVRFGELTFTPAAALDNKRLPETDLRFGRRMEGTL